MNNTTQQATEKALADFRVLPYYDKYKECIHYGNMATTTDINTVNGRLSVRIMDIYGKNFLFILLNGEVINCYELQ